VHIHSTRKTGYEHIFARIKGFDTPEQIEKWKAERRNNFPTPENIARKKAERLERHSREHFSSRKIEDSDIMYPGAKDVFRYKVIPEDRKRRKPEWRGRKGHPAYRVLGVMIISNSRRMR
jgi:hypothetical protein